MLDLNQIYNTDALEGLKQLDENSVDAIISDPPYQLTSMTRGRPDQTEEGEYGREVPFSRVQSRIKGFMNKDWDILPSIDILKECLRVLKSGAWALWLMTPRQDSQFEFLLRLRQAGFNISFSSVEWVYASGFPKAADLSLLADKKACREDLIQKLTREPTKEEFKEAWSKFREITGYSKNHPDFIDLGTKTKEREGINKLGIGITAERKDLPITNPHSSEAQALSGSYAGMQLKPARELIIVSQKPIAGKTYLDQALLHLKEPEHNQLGGTWLDDCRVPYKQGIESGWAKTGADGSNGYQNSNTFKIHPISAEEIQERNNKGRFPANIIVSDNALDIGITHTSGNISGKERVDSKNSIFGITYENRLNYNNVYGDSGDLSRYFDLDFWFENKLKELPEEQQKIFPFMYVPKASKSERNKGLSEEGTGSNTYNRKCLICGKWERKQGFSDDYTCHCQNPKWEKPKGNIHATVKPIKLMSYLITLTTRENNIVLDPFTGSGTTAISSILLKRRFIGFEREEEYYKIATERIKYYQKQ